MSIPVIGGIPKDLTYISDEECGFTRLRRGKGFRYCDEQNTKLTDKAVLERIAALGIPPAWTDVWIAKNPNGHLQCTGYDPKNRKQYIYHEQWNAYRSEAKFRKLIEFGLSLPAIRRQSSDHLKASGWPRAKVLALVIQMLDEYHIRIGNEYYRQQNETFGLTTLRRKHFEFEKGVGRLEYKAKSGKYRKISIKNNQLAKLVKQSSELRGYALFKYKGADGKYHHINSHDVNEYLRDLSEEEFSCKDFRTWGGTTLAVERYEKALQLLEENPRLKLETAIVKLVAKELGNTVSICRKYYIHPKVMQVLIDGNIDQYRDKPFDSLPKKEGKLLSKSEVTVLNIIS